MPWSHGLSFYVLKHISSIYHLCRKYYLGFSCGWYLGAQVGKSRIFNWDPLPPPPHRGKNCLYMIKFFQEKREQPDQRPIKSGQSEDNQTENALHGCQWDYVIRKRGQLKTKLKMSQQDQDTKLGQHYRTTKGNDESPPPPSIYLCICWAAFLVFISIMDFLHDFSASLGTGIMIS